MGGGGVESMSLKPNQAEFVFTGGCPLRCWEIGGRRAHENLEGDMKVTKMIACAEGAP